MSFSRRDFLTMLAASGASLPGLPSLQAFAHTLSPHSLLSGDTKEQDNTVLVIVRLFGGNDGLNTVVPYTDENYYKARRDRQYDISIKPEAALKLPNSSTAGLHPALGSLKTLYDENKVLIVQNVGYAEQDLSHFRSNEIWLTASDPSVYEQSGWLGRFLEARYPDYPRILPEAPFALEMGRSLSRTLAGRTNTTLGVNVNDASFIPQPPTATSAPYGKAAREVEFVRESLRQSNVFLTEIARVWEKEARNRVEYPKHEWSSQLSRVARLIAGGMKTRLYLINTALWDFHHNQLADQAQMLRDLGDAIYAFQRDLEAFGVSKRVVVLTISEFGRRLETTHSGTDHGAASCLFLVGERVNAGIIGSDPDCSNTDADGNIRWQYDFRQIYASLLAQWLGAKPDEISPSALPHAVEQLPLIRGAFATAWRRELSSSVLDVSPICPNPASVQAAVIVNVSALPKSERNLPLLVLVSDMRGNLIESRFLETSLQEVEIIFDVRFWASGSYIVELELGGMRCTRLLSVVR